MIKRVSIQFDNESKKCNVRNAETQEYGTSSTLKQHTKECWLLENQQAITVYNQHITDHGVFSDGLRCF